MIPALLLMEGKIDILQIKLMTNLTLKTEPVDGNLVPDWVKLPGASTVLS